MLSTLLLGLPACLTPPAALELTPTATATPVDVATLCGQFPSPFIAIATAIVGGPNAMATLQAGVTPGAATPTPAGTPALHSRYSSPSAAIVYQRQHPGWVSYASCLMSQQLLAGSYYDKSDGAAVQAYVSANNAASAQIPVNEKIPASITFKYAVPESEVAALVQTTSVESRSSEVSVQRPDGTRFHVAGPAMGGSTLPPNWLGMQIAIRGEPAGSAIEGILVLNVRLDRAGFDALVKHPGVLVVEVSQELARREVARHFNIDPASLRMAGGGMPPESFLAVAFAHGLVASTTPVGSPSGMLPSGQPLSPSLATAIANLPGNVTGSGVGGPPPSLPPGFTPPAFPPNVLPGPIVTATPTFTATPTPTPTPVTGP